MKHLAALNPFFWKYRYRFLLGIIFILLTNYFRILAPQLTGYVVNTVVTSSSAAINLAHPLVVHKKGYDFVVQLIITELESKPVSFKIVWCSIIYY